MSSPDVIVIGAGVLGLSSAATLATRGHAVTVVDPGGANASSVAAGMIAPAMETLGDLKGGMDHGALFQAAAGLWPGFAGTHGLILNREGAAWRGPGAGEVVETLTARGFTAHAVEEGFFAPNEARVDAGPALAALADGITMRAGRAARIARDGDGRVVTLDDGEQLTARHVVVASGVGVAVSGPLSLEALTGLITPIKGQLAFTPERLGEQVVRGAAGYVAPAGSGSVIGATMQAGAADLAVDVAAGEALVRGCLAMIGVDAVPTLEWRVGVRGASPDGLPMAGMVEPGLHVALAPRRNGWLLGPLVAQIVADGVEGRAPGEWAAALDPFRFG
ncbi:MAG: NAD(P)/FAD-dependent oxidoreductase [Brevundimonas sp.]